MRMTLSEMLSKSEMILSDVNFSDGLNEETAIDFNALIEKISILYFNIFKLKFFFINQNENVEFNSYFDEFSEQLKYLHRNLLDIIVLLYKRLSFDSELSSIFIESIFNKLNLVNECVGTELTNESFLLNDVLNNSESLLIVYNPTHKNIDFLNSNMNYMKNNELHKELLQYILKNPILENSLIEGFITLKDKQIYRIITVSVLYSKGLPVEFSVVNKINS